MVDRVGTWAFSQTLLNEYSRIQFRTQTTQQQISTGKVGDQFADAKDKAGVLAAAKMRAGEVDALSATTKEVLTRLNLQDVHLVELSDISARLRTAIGNALASGHAPAFMDEVKGLFDDVVQILNSKVDGKYIYGGSKTDQPPVNATTLAQLVAAPTVADVFDNTDMKLTQRIDENETIEVGMTASDIGTDIMQMFKDIATFDSGAGGPFGLDLTPAQTTFLSTTHAAVPAVQDGINTLAAINGSRHGQATQTSERHEGMSAYFAQFIGDIEDVDLAEAVARLNQDQVAAEAAGRMIAQVNTMSLLNFLEVG
jgi:flagellar hook-associated protein 3 FlgL